MANKTILVCGHGPGISDAVARKFGAQGYAVGLIARSADKIGAAAKALAASGINAVAFPTELGDAAAVKAMVGRAREQLGPIAIVHWNACGQSAGDVARADLAELRAVFEVGVIGLMAAVQASMADLKAQKGAVLITGGGFSLYDAKIDAMAVQQNAMGLAVAKAAQHKLGGLLAEKLRPDGIYVGEVTVLGTVRGTPADKGNATIEPAAVAEKFWALFTARGQHIDHIG